MSDHDDNRLMAERRRKLADLRAGGTAYPNDFRRDAFAGELHAAFGDLDEAALSERAVRVRVAGRMVAKRVMGKSSFVSLQDMSGRIQLFLARDQLAEGIYAAFKTWDVGDVVAAEGELFRTRTGELSVRAETVRLMTKSLRPLPEKYHGLSDVETRYRQRYVDLIVNDDSRAVFMTRAAAIRFLRGLLDDLGFVEVETPMMQPIPGGALARPFVTHHNALDMQLYLRIAPELYLKRLLVGGLEQVYEINRNFRNEGLSTRHNPEFTMLELYQAFADVEDIMGLTETMLRETARHIHGIATLEYQGEQVDFEPPFARVTIEDAVSRAIPSLDTGRRRDPDYLRAVLDTHQIPCAAGYGAGKMLMELFEKTAEADLRQPTFVTGFPTEVSPLSRQRDDDPFLADRFELYACGTELANGFSELNDPEEQANRFREQAASKADGDDEAMFYDADYIRALEYGMPPAGGLGVGIDRFVMLLTNAPSIRDVLLFPLMRPEADNQS